jgi:hypothetical protein
MPLLRHGLLIGSLIVGTSVNPRPEHHPEFWETIAICCAALLAEPGLLAHRRSGPTSRHREVR